MRWIPIEANPDIINQFMQKVGVKSHWQCVDVYGIDPELLEFVPKPVISLLLLYPLTQAVMNKPIGKIVPESDVIFIKQTIGNACGTIGILHSLCNNRETFEFPENTFINSFTDKMIPLTPNERAKVIEQEEFLSAIHEEVALDGQSAVPDVSEHTDLHFVSFVHKNGKLYELDGRESGPKYHGDCNENNFFFKAIDVIKQFMNRDPDEHKFNVIAIARND